ncbi:exodeoxyribonuclease V subunit gamma [Vibrio nigripulchritudo]|uniref:exodeoxyribonuclease V subunit gamma n=1 Tax=Vibrio nigripulchritudo TaxID=28173 RepID=UPI0005FA42BF|nr:exodeoxyribonuclease V subunit gamma [Vibrio nigripulchritudo]KJY80429.1 exonuclease V subunit gamma [Vibrio nigripulchritudo]
MFTVYHSNQIELLKSLLVELIKLSPLENPFEAEQILVQSPGMSQWLKMELAKEFGVAANIDFPLPATFIWECFTHVLPDVPSRSAFNKEAMTWKLMDILPTLLDKPDFSALNRYLEGDEDHAKLFQLSEKIADIFDGYLVYRPEWIATWESGEAVAEIGEEHPWQPILWQALYDKTVSLGQSPYHRANLYEHFIDALAHTTPNLEELPKRLFVFGISSLPPRYMDALKALGEHIDVHLMFTNPCRYYWGEVRDRKYLAKLAARHRKHVEWKQDHSEAHGVSEQLKGDVEDNVIDELHTDVVGNSLLASMGKLGRDNMYLLSQLEAHEVEAFVDVDRDSILHQLQADILNLEEHQKDDELETSEHKQVVQLGDKSLSVHACHSPMREVEVLHDQLLAMFDADPNLKPRDIIVMVADINAYSPAIQAVFGNAPGERFIPYSISDRTAQEESPVLNAFMQLMLLPDSRFQASEMLELLEVPAIMARFGLNEDQFERAKIWIEEIGVRWGLDEQTAGQFELPQLNQNTWLFGIQRMLLGYAMPESAGLFEGERTIAAYNEVQGMDAELAGKLAHYVDTLNQFQRQLNATQSAQDWHRIISDMLDAFFSVELEGEMALKSIRDTMSQLLEQLSDAGYQETLSHTVLQQYLHNKLSGTRVSQRFLAGQVNFCTLMPMRSIPFKLVCLLGMNDGAYPRSMSPEGFDLMNNRARPGDRSRRDDDRYLFLEALLSAQQSLYISYVGRSIQDNTEKVPSVLVSELLEYCHQNYCLEDDLSLGVDTSGDKLLDSLIHIHPMVPFSPDAFSGEDKSYAKEWLPSVNRLGARAGAFEQPLDDYLAEMAAPYQLDLVELQRFWRLPVQYFFNRRLKVFFEPPMATMENDEPFTLGGLQSYKMRDELVDTLLQCRLNGEPEEPVLHRYMEQQRAKGLLPVGAFGELEFAANREQTDAMVNVLYPLTGKPLEDSEVRLELSVEGEPCELTGWLTQRYQSGLLRYRSGKIRAQDWLAAWIDHLCLAAMGQSSRTHLIGYDKKEGVVHWVISPLAGSIEENASQAKMMLQELVRLFYQGMNQPLAYFPKTALAGIQACINKAGEWVDDEEAAFKKMADAFNDGYLFPGEGSDRYIQRIWSSWDDDLGKAIRLNASLVLQAAVLATHDAEEG